MIKSVHCGIDKPTNAPLLRIIGVLGVRGRIFGLGGPLAAGNGTPLGLSSPSFGNGTLSWTVIALKSSVITGFFTTTAADSSKNPLSRTGSRPRGVSSPSS